MTHSDPILTEITDGVAILTLNRPTKRNALSDDLLRALCEALETVNAADTVRVAVIDGAGGVFAAGADVSRFRNLDHLDLLNDPRPGWWTRIAALPKPLIAAVEGYCLGAGLELAMHCDILIAAEDAHFGLPEVGLGLMPGAGGTQRLPRSVGKSDAMLMTLTADRYPAQRVREMGLVSEVVASGGARDRACEIAQRIAQRPPLSVRFAKQAINQAYESALQAGLAHERALYLSALSTEDAKEGVAAFLEKRSASFKGR